jgi:hypothetical protein
MKSLFSSIAFSAIIGFGIATSAFAADTMAAAPESKTITGDLQKIDGEFYVLKDSAGKEVRLHVDKTSKLDGAFKAGDKIEAQASDKGHAVSMKHETHQEQSAK